MIKQVIKDNAGIQIESKGTIYKFLNCGNDSGLEVIEKTDREVKKDLPPWYNNRIQRERKEIIDYVINNDINSQRWHKSLSKSVEIFINRNNPTEIFAVIIRDKNSNKETVLTKINRISWTHDINQMKKLGNDLYYEIDDKWRNYDFREINLRYWYTVCRPLSVTYFDHTDFLP